MRSLLMNELEPVAYLIYMLAVLLQLKHHRSFRYTVLAVYYAICAVILYIGIVFSEINNWTYNILFFANILVLSKYYLELFVGKIKKKIIISCCIFNALLFIYINIISFKYNDYNNYVYAISFITIVLYSLLYLHQLLINLKEESLLLNFDFWLVCAYLLYFLGAFIIILFYNYTNDHIARGDLWVMHNTILFTCSVFTMFISLQILKKNNLQHV